MKHMWILVLLIAIMGSAHAQDRPNVVVMLADNVGYGDIGAYGAGEIRGMPTPRIDQLASEGLRLTQYLVEPACTPSRAALMTGRYSQRVGLSTVIVGGTPNTLQASEVTLGELFKSQGYATAIAGKWHLGSSEHQLADPPGLRRVPRRRLRDHRRHPVSRRACSAPGCPRPPSPRPSPASGSPKRTET